MEVKSKSSNTTSITKREGDPRLVNREIEENTASMSIVKCLSFANQGVSTTVLDKSWVDLRQILHDIKDFEKK
jgi:hypothetical protein